MTEATILSRRIYPAAAFALMIERDRQQTKLGWDKDHDRTHNPSGQLDVAGRCYIAHATGQPYTVQSGVPVTWPWDASYWKPQKGKAECLIAGGALLLAELDRLAAQNLPVPNRIQDDIGLTLMELSDLIDAYVSDNKDLDDKLMQALDKAPHPPVGDFQMDNPVTGVHLAFEVCEPGDEDDEDDEDDDTIEDLDDWLAQQQATLRSGPTLVEDIKGALEELFGCELTETSPGVFIGKAKLSEVTPMSGILGAERHGDYPHERTYANGGSGSPLFEFFRQFVIQYLDATETTATSKGHEFMRHLHNGTDHWKDATKRDGLYPLYHAVLAYFRHHEDRLDAINLTDRFSEAWLQKRNANAA